MQREAGTPLSSSQPPERPDPDHPHPELDSDPELDSGPRLDSRPSLDAGPELDAGTVAAAGGSSRHTPTTTSGRPVGLLVALTLLVLVADQASKAWALVALDDGFEHPIIGHLLRFQLIRNPGAALSLGTGSTWILTLVALAVVIVVIRSARRLVSRSWAWAFGLLLGGALGNLVDRFVRQPGFLRGEVVDFIGYGNLFIGNVADIAIVAAAILIALLAVRGVGLDGRRPSAQADR